ncbi:MAG TPA: ABC transporter ATP-binding protein [Bacilli bacterium]|nr:ABC transporter ATP-binding protein [Bacilli bacterium]
MKNQKVENAQDPKKALKRLLAYLKSFKKKFIIVIIFAFFSIVFSIVGPKILGLATTKLYEGMLTSNINFDYILMILAILLILYGLSAIFQYTLYYIMSGMSGAIALDLRKKITLKIDRLPISYYDKHNYGDTLSRIVNDVDTIVNNINNGLIQTIMAAFLLIGIIIMMISINIILSLVVIVVLPLSGIIVAAIVKKSQKYFVKNQESIARVNDHIEENYGGHLVIKAFNRESVEIKKFNKLNDNLYRNGFMSQFLGGIIFPMIRLLGNICYILAAVLGGYYVINGKITIGDLQAFIQYAKQFLQPVSSAARVVSVFQSTAAAAERVFEFLDEEEVEVLNNSLALSNPKGNVVFSNVSFSYNKGCKVIKNLTLNIKAGDKVAIVGPTGAGKTTIVNLLMKFYKIDSGKILIDDKDINEIDDSSLRKIFGMVLQDTWLFNDTIIDNIKFGNLKASREEVIKACKMAQVDHFVETLPDTYDLVINEEASNIAEGEKQLLTIARALIAEPSILILDEATSNVDTRTEILIQKAMNNLMKDKTSFIIAHRLSTIRGADLILVMNEGNVVEQGTHEELMKKKGFYYELYNSQFES